MTDIATLNLMINDNAKIPLINNYGKAYVELVEADAPESRVKINGLPQNTLVIKIDDAFKNDQFFSGLKGECKRADYVIVAETDNKKKNQNYTN